MKLFLLKILIFSIMYFSIITLVFLQVNGSTDPFYKKFTSSKQSSMIIGSSRAAQGLDPKHINKQLERNDIFNYAFTLGHSPYGIVYLKSIKKKLDPNTKNGIFILSVDPWSISNPNTIKDNHTSFPEADRMLGRTKYVNLNPNFPYLFQSYGEPYYTIIYNSNNFTFLHDNGWLEVSLAIDSASVAKRTKRKLKEYKEEHLYSSIYSYTRKQYLDSTILYLKSFGDVYLVRLPVSPEMMNIENLYMPTFNDTINDIANKTNTAFFDLTYLNNATKFTDGNHINRESAAVVSKILGQRILLHRQKISKN